MSKRPLPHPAKVVDARLWLQKGAPALGEPDARIAVKTLLELLDALPSHIEQYCWGKPAWHEAMDRPEDP